MSKKFWFRPFIWCGLILAVVACDQPQPGFSVEGSALRFEKHEFEDATTLAATENLTLSKEQVLGQSPVIKDLAQQENDAMIGLIYLKALSSIPESERQNKAKVLEVFIKPSEEKAELLLARFGQKPSPALAMQFLPATDQTTLARLDQREFRREDVDVRHFVFQSMEQRRLRETVQLLSGQLSRTLLSQEAGKQGMNLQEFLQQKIYPQGTSVSDSELKEYLDSISFSQQELTEELRERFLQVLSEKKQMRLMEEYAAKHLLKSPVKVSFSKPEAKLELDESFQPIRGYDDAPVTLVVFAGATCTDCPSAVYTAYDLMSEFDGYLKLNWIYYFSSSNGLDHLMAEAALCAEGLRQGLSLDFLREFSSASGQVDESSFYAWVAEKKLDPEQFKKCLTSGQNSQLVDQHLKYANSLGIVSVPTLWLDGVMIEGRVHQPEVHRLMKKIIAEKNISPWSAGWRRWKHKLRALF